jgi:hypothetical protein
MYIHPKIAYKILNQLGFKRRRGLDNVIFMESLKMAERENRELMGINENGRIYLKYLVGAINDNKSILNPEMRGGGEDKMDKMESKIIKYNLINEIVGYDDLEKFKGKLNKFKYILENI